MSGFRRARKYLIPTLLIVILAVSILASYLVVSDVSTSKGNPGTYVGIAFCGNTTQQAKLLIDKVKSYTNLFILAVGRNPISANQTSIEEICDYAVSSGLSVIVDLGWREFAPENQSWFWRQPSLEPIEQNWTQRWGDKFLGVYYNDEIGGVQLDANWTEFFQANGPKMNTINNTGVQDMYQIYLKILNSEKTGIKPQNYDLEANFFVNDCVRGDFGLEALASAGFKTFMSDYGLYWWDYMGGYNVIFAELGWNNSVTEQIDLVKGAARLQDKEWGVMITWKYDSAPYLDSSGAIYNEMLTSYEAGAKYIAVFDYPYVAGNSYGVLSDAQFSAIQKFWNDITQKKYVEQSGPDVALVLPQNYGWGMRNPNDTIWGFWPPDDKTPQVCLAVDTLLARYGINLDIVFEDPAYPVSTGHYQAVYYWNQTFT
jgi:hypothetical protein